MPIACCSALRATPLTASIGAVVDGVDLADLRPGPALVELRHLLDRHQVLFFQQQHLDTLGLLGLSERFGRPTIHPVDRLVGSSRSVSTIVDSAEHPPAGFDWHTDLSWLPAPPRFGFLAAVEIPTCGGDTLWASGAAVWARAPAALRAQLAGACLVHRLDPALLASVGRHHGDDVARALERAHPPVAHPLVRAHPGTGESVAYLSPLYADRVLGRPQSGLDELHGMLDDPAVHVRWTWADGDVAIWDEAATVHRALVDHFPQRRVVRRCTTDGPVPRASVPGQGLRRPGVGR
jgi:taurine dioxygenase